MICIRVKNNLCVGGGCPQSKSHPADQFCGNGFCRQSEELTHCVPETRREHTDMLVQDLIMDDRFAKLTGQELVAKITEIVEEVTNERA